MPAEVNGFSPFAGHSDVVPYFRILLLLHMRRKYSTFGELEPVIVELTYASNDLSSTVSPRLSDPIDHFADEDWTHGRQKLLRPLDGVQLTTFDDELNQVDPRNSIQTAILIQRHGFNYLLSDRLLLRKMRPS